MYCVVVTLLGSLVEWDSPSLGARVDILPDSSRIIYLVVGLSLGSDTGCPLGVFLVSGPSPPFGLYMAVEKPPGSKVRYPDFLVSPL